MDHPEDLPTEPLWEVFRRERAEYSLYLYSPNNYFRKALKVLVESLLFQALIMFTVMIAIIPVITGQ